MKRSFYNLGKYKLLTADMGKMYPIGVTEVLPADSIRMHSNAFVRFAPMVRPIMHPIQAHIMHVFIPHRLSWEKAQEAGLATGTWEEFITGGKTNQDTQTVPTINTEEDSAKSLLDFMGIQPTDNIDVNALPVIGLNLFWNEFIRDQDLQQERAFTDISVPNVSWQKDYFTTARPWEQKGDEVTIPLGTSAPVRNIDGNTLNFYIDGPTPYPVRSNNDGSNLGVFAAGGPNNDAPISDLTGLSADLSNAEAVPINEFRRAFALQRFAENRARYGSRYAEYLRMAFNVKNRDARLQRPQILGGGRQTLSVSEVLSTVKQDEPGQSGSLGPLGDLGGHGIGMLKTNRFQRFFDEHGYIISVMFIRPKAIYTQGMERHWLYRDKEDFFQKELSFIGQQAIYNNEVFADADNGMNIFGYSDRNRHLRESRSDVAGEFRTSLMNDWHLGRDFGSTPPALNNEFITCNPSKRIFADQTNDTFWLMVNHSIKAKRVVPKSAAGRII